MLSIEQFFFIQTLSDFINGKETKPIKELNWNDILDYSKVHQVAGIIYYQCKRIIDNQNVYTELLKCYTSTLYHHANIKNEYKLIASELINNNIPYVQVKGLQLANLYPVPELRTMGDIDLLIRGKDFRKVTELFFKHDYIHGKETDHEISFKKRMYYYEIHEFMVNKPQGEDEIQKLFFNKYWEHIIKDLKNEEKTLEWSFHFLFLLQHMRQHILWEGIGFRQFIDMAIVIKNIDLDWEYISECAKTVELYEFLCIIIGLIEKWFKVSAPINCVELDESTFEYITQKVFNDGVFGFNNDENQTNEFEKDYRSSKKFLITIKMQTIGKMLFPTYHNLRNVEHYSFLNGRPFLLPFAWLYRAIYALKHRKFDQVRQVKRIAKLNKEKLDKRRNDIEMWGL